MFCSPRVPLLHRKMDGFAWHYKYELTATLMEGSEEDGAEGRSQLFCPIPIQSQSSNYGINFFYLI